MSIRFRLKKAIKMRQFYWSTFLGGVVVSTLDFRSKGQWFDAQSIHCVVSLDKKLDPTLSLSTPVYKWVPATYCWG